MPDKPPREPTFLGAPPPGPAPTPPAISEPAAVVRTALEAIRDAVPGGPGARPIGPALDAPVPATWARTATPPTPSSTSPSLEVAAQP